MLAMLMAWKENKQSMRPGTYSTQQKLSEEAPPPRQSAGTLTTRGFQAERVPLGETSHWQFIPQASLYHGIKQ